jgi:PAB-dependent poly(A)-specific ribonuclease subunit 3
MFGRLVFTLYCNNLAAMNTLPKALDMIGRQYSVVKTLALYLIYKDVKACIDAAFGDLARASR